MLAAKELGGLSYKHIYTIFTDSAYRYTPLNSLTQSFIYHFFNLNPFGYHMVSWILHGLNAGLLFLIIRKLLVLSLAIQESNKRVHWQINIVASLTTLFWAIHPLRVEPVAWAAASAHNNLSFSYLFQSYFILKQQPLNIIQSDICVCLD